MQKVEGSNPFSRFARKPRSGGAFLCPNPEARSRCDLLRPDLAAQLLSFPYSSLCSEWRVRISR
jgi:hypothetical protein